MGSFSRVTVLGLYLSLIASPGARGGSGALEIRNGYFWDPLTLEYFVPRGVAYQTWNPPVGADQTFAQVDYDLTEIKKLQANSIRGEMVWNEVEREPGVFDWTRPDYLVSKAEELGFKLFVLIGFQFAPLWFPEEWKAIDDHGGRSVVLNYEHPEARRAYTNYIAQVTSRYRNSTAIGGWILGNEYAYFDLWNPDHFFLGYDPISKASFQQFLSERYLGNIAGLNANWGTSYSNFNQVAMPQVYPSNRNNPGYHDLILWREQSIGDYVAVGAVAARAADPNHLLTYSMVGGLFIGNDANHTCEDAKTIVARCAAAGAPLDFWSINNYAWASLVGELRSGDFGISKHLAHAGLPVMISETGHSTTDNLLPGAAERQAEAVPSQIWEALMSGALGAHIFTWNDRELFGGIFIREKGFGFVHQNRLPKGRVYDNLKTMFRRMESLKVERLFGGSSNPAPDIQLFWSKASLMGWPRANQENAMLWGTLKRIGYQPGFLDDEQFARGEHTNAAALVVSRGYQLDPADLDRLVTEVVPRGIHLHADADLPGEFDAYHRRNANWPSAMNALFGLNVNNARPGWDSGVTFTEYHPLALTVANSLGALMAGARDSVDTWKIWHGITATAGSTIATHTGDRGLQSPMPALQIRDLGTARTAVTTFALTDLLTDNPPSPTHDWDFRRTWVEAIYRHHFGIRPVIDLSGPGARYVIPDYRICANGSILVSLLNGYTNATEVAVNAPSLLRGKTVENLTRGGITETNSDGTIELSLAGDEFVLLYAYSRGEEADASLVNSNPNKVWIETAPAAVWPGDQAFEVAVGYDLRTNATLVLSLERILAPGKSYFESAPISVSGAGTRAITVQVPDADLGDIQYMSSRAGGQYAWRARLEGAGGGPSEATLPVRLLWGVAPESLPAQVIPGSTQVVTLGWEELPSYEPAEEATPLSRADLWESRLGRREHYEVVLELRATNGLALATDRRLTSAGTDRQPFTLSVPSNATGPFHWFAYVRPAPGASVDLFDNFEDRGPGANELLLRPWTSYVYSDKGTARYFDSGIQTEGFCCRQSAFVVVTNPPNPGAFSGFGIVFDFPQDWALPPDRLQWTDYAFSFDFREAASLPCTLELQVKDAFGGQIEFSKLYLPGMAAWDTIRAPLSAFTNSPFTARFNGNRVHSLVANVRMEQTAAVYVATFDNIQFDGPERFTPAVSSRDVNDSFEDRGLGDDPATIRPWGGYVFAQNNNAKFLAQGVHTNASDGFQSAFMAVENPAVPGDFSGFGLFYIFTSEWSLPADRLEWSRYTFAFDFHEANRHPCQIELQVKSGELDWIEFTKVYTPGANGWDTVRTSLDQFTQPSGAGLFDPAKVQSLAVNVRMLQTDAIYVGSFDQIRFDGPDTELPRGPAVGIYRSDNDSPADADRDGISDRFETGTGIYRGPNDTGTSPSAWDSDGDGLGDGQELFAGTDPNSPADVLRLAKIERSSNGEVVLGWPARAGRAYSVYYRDGDLFEGARFIPLEALAKVRAKNDGPVEVIDATAGLSGQRTYLIAIGSP